MAAKNATIIKKPKKAKRVADLTGREVSVIKSRWTDSFTARFIGKRGTLKSKTAPNSMVEVYINSSLVTFHVEEIEELEHFAIK